MDKKTRKALDGSIDNYKTNLIDATTNSAIRAHIMGDILAHRDLGLPVLEMKVQAEALEFGKQFKKMLVDDGASIVRGKKIAWLADNTDATRLKVFDTVEAGLKEFKSIPEISKDLSQLAIRDKKYQYDRIARTTTGQIQNRGAINRYKKNGITHVHVHDGDGCEACAAVNGSIWTVEFAEVNELEHPNCLTKNTKVMGEFNGIMRSYYSGPIIDIITKLGRRLSVTPNHPILTREGFVPAKFIQNGSELVCYSPFVEDTSVYPDDEHEPIVIEEIFNMLSLLCVTERVPVSPEDLHGDAVSGDGYVDIIDMHSHLPYNFKPHALKQLSDRLLGASAPDEVLLSSVCSHDFGVDCVLPATSGTPSTRDHLFFFGGGVPPSFPNKLNCLRAGSNVNSILFESAFNDGFGTMEFIAKLGESNAGLVEFDYVVDITIREYDDYVYDLLTNTKYYNASGVFIHNCVRNFSAVIPDDWEPPEDEPTSVQVDKIQTMSPLPVPNAATVEYKDGLRTTLSRNEFAAIEDYTDINYYDVNSWLVNKKANMLTTDVDVIKTTIKDLDSAFAKTALTTDMTLMRGISGEVAEGMIKNGKMSYKGYSSATESLEVAAQFARDNTLGDFKYTNVLVIDAKKGLNAVRVGGYEAETMLNRGLNLEIVHMKEVESVVTVGTTPEPVRFIYAKII